MNKKLKEMMTMLQENSSKIEQMNKDFMALKTESAEVKEVRVNEDVKLIKKDISAMKEQMVIRYGRKCFDRRK